MGLEVVVLAAGQGTRMRSGLPKVLQPLAGRPLLAHVLDTAYALGAAGVHVVIGHGGPAVREAFAGRQHTRWVEQASQLGTGHAVEQAMPGVPDDAVVLVLYGDVPLVETETLGRLVERAEQGTVAVLTVDLIDPTGYGRIIRGRNGQVLRIVEEKDATEAEKAIREVNTGLMAAPAARLRPWLAALDNDNAQGEFYLTDVVALAVAEGVGVNPVAAGGPDEVLGINDRRQLAEAESALRQRTASALLDAGVTLVDPARVDVRGRLECGQDVHIDIGAVFEGDVSLADGVRIGPYCVVRQSSIGAGTELHPYSLVDQSVTGPDCTIGPYARLRPGTRLAEGAKVGNFVEIKNAEIGAGSKVNHLTYVGDASVGKDVNVGAGTITCNYDGANKHRTVIGDGAFIGSGVELVAPVEVGSGATIGAGSTISKTAPAGQLTVERSRQITVKGWERPKKGGAK
jgi:bifunctional UDP-N-acetylglucosamine pyrophosphorylase/glucosamine-1-phosphate N-acetyltransferase